MSSEASRREVLRGMAIGAAGMVLGPVTSFAGTQEKSKMLPRSNAESLGVNPAGISAFIDEVNQKVGGLHSMILLRHGKVAAEAWWTPYEPKRPHMLFSLSKSFTSTAVGLAVSEGKLTVEDKVVSFFPDKLPANVSENLAAMRVKDLLTMSTGNEKEPSRNTNDWVKEFLAAPVERKPGTHFLYNTSATHMLAAIVEKLAGERLLKYLTPRLLSPLGIEGATWEQSPAGIDFGGSGLSIKTEDIAKFGQLYLQKGKWDGKQLVSAAWIAEATKYQVSNGNPNDAHDWCQGYGYQFWRCRHGFYRGDGAFGQYCIVMDDLDAVLAINSGVPDMGAVMNAAWTHLIPAMKAGAPTDGAEKLRKQLTSQQVPSPAGSATSPLASKISGKTFKIEDNPEGIKAIKLTFEKDRCVIERTLANSTQRIVCGTSGWLPSQIVEGNATRAGATRGAWIAENRFALKTCFVESPFEWNEAYVFDGDKVTVEARALNVFFGPTARPNLTGKVE